MKRKIGIIVALVLAAVGVLTLKGENVWADETLGKGENQIYCAFEASQTQSIKDCVVILAYYHPTDYSDGWTKSNIKKHVTITENYYSVQNGGRTAAKAYELLYNNYNNNKNSLINAANLPYNTMQNAVTQCNKISGGATSCIKGAGTGFTKKVGKNKLAICYTDYWDWTEFYGTCSGNITPGGLKPSDGDDGDDDDDGDSGPLDTDVPGGDPKKCSTLLPQSWCSKGGIGEVLTFIVAVLNGTVIVAGTVGIIVCAIVILTARDNEQQLATGKKRLMQVIIGMVAWIMLAVLANLFIPKTEDEIQVELNSSVKIIDGDEEA